jgi:hypothetical protein
LLFRKESLAEASAVRCLKFSARKFFLRRGSSVHRRHDSEQINSQGVLSSCVCPCRSGFIHSTGLALERAWPHASLQLTYLELDTNEVFLFREETSREVLIEFLNETVEEWFSWLIPQWNGSDSAIVDRIFSSKAPSKRPRLKECTGRTQVQVVLRRSVPS